MTDYLQLARERAAGAPPSDAANPYMGIAQENQRRQETQLRGIVERALKDDPELAAERQRLSQTSGLPLSVVERNLDEIRRKEAARALDIARMMRDSPVLSRQLLDPSFTTVAQDDIGVLGQIERFARDLGGAAKAGVFRASRGAAGTFQAGLELVAPVLDPLESVTAIGGNPLRRLAEGFALQGAAAGRTAEAARPRTDGVLGAGFFGGIESLTQNLLALPMAFLPGGQGAALTMMTAGTGGGAYQDAREKGLPMSQALPFAASQAAIEYATEKLPLGALLKDVRAGAGFLQILGRQIALEVPGEQIATVLQDLNEWAILNPDKPFSAYLEERPSAAAQTLVATIVGTGGNVAVVKGLESVMSRLAADGANMQRAGLAGQALQRAFELAGQSALRERSPEQFRALMGQMSGDAKLYVDGEVLNQLPPEALAQLPAAVRDRIPLAAATGDMVEIAVADALTVAPGTPLAETLTQNARTSPEAPSLREARVAGEQAQVYLQQEAERVIQQAADQAAARASQEAVKQNIKQQLAATGRFRDAVNEGYATWAAAFYTAYGSRLGMTPEQFYQRYPLRVLGAAPGQQTGVLNAPRLGRLDNLEGFHFSKQDRPVITTAAFGTGLEGSSREQYLNAADQRLRKRSYFYVDKGTGINPEAGVGGRGQRVNLDNVYDADADPLRLKTGRDQLGFESAVLDAGFAGYLTRMEGSQSGQVIMLGDQTFRAEVLGPLGRTQGRPVPPPVQRPAAGRDVVADALRARRDLPAGELPRQRWGEILQRLAPTEYEALAAAGVFEGEGRFYKDGLIREFESRTQAPTYEQAMRVDPRLITGPQLFAPIIDALGLTEAEVKSTAMEYMTGLPGDMAFLPPEVGGIPEIVQFLHQRRMASGLPVLDIAKPADRAQLARLMAAEALAAIQSAGNALEWYDKTIRTTLGLMAVKYPELETNPSARNAFLMAMAITSQGMNVETNLGAAIEQYDAYRLTVDANGVGQFPERGWGESAGEMAANFRLANEMLREMGPELLRRFLTTPFTVAELRQAGFDPGGELADELVLGSSVFGPKIGFGFYSNLSGNFDPVTMDMWFMRTKGRLAGTLPSFSPELLVKQLTRLRASLKERGRKERGLYASQFDSDLVKRAATDEAAAIELARLVARAHERDYRNNRADFDSGKRVKSEMVYAASAILVSLDKPTDAPTSGGERRLLRDVVRQAVDLVSQNYSRPVPAAAFQALIWYPEQELYSALGAKLAVTSQDYAGAARKILDEAGLSKEDLDAATQRAAAQSGPDGARQANGQPVSGAAPSNGQVVGGTGPLTPTERTQFIATRNARLLAEQRAAAARVAFEVAPDPNDGALTDRWRQLTQPQRLEISDRVARAIVPKVLKFLKAKGEVLPQVGSYLEDTNPSFALRVDKGDVDQLSKILGFVLSQDSMMAIAPAEFPGAFKSQALRIAVGEKTTAEIDQIYQTLRAIALPDGRRPIAGQSTSGGVMTVLLDSQDDAATVGALVDQALAGAYNVTGHDVFAAFPEKQDYDYALPQGDPAGNEGLARQRARDARAEASDLLRKELDTAAAAGQPAAATESAAGQVLEQAGRAQIATPEFQAFTGGAPLVLAADASKHQFETGKPVVVEGFHGTRRNFDRVDPAQASAGYFLSSKPVVADEYAGVLPEGMGGGAFPLGGNVQRQYARMDNPLVINARGASFNRVDTRAVPGYPLPMSNTDAINQWAKQQGYDGVIYKDLRDSLARPDGRNAPPSNVYVVFEPTSVKSAIGNIGAFDRGQASFLAQGPRGTFNPATLELVLNPNADLSTWFHETGHFFLEVLADVASQPGAPAQIAEDYAKVLAWFGVTPEQWASFTLDEKRPYHERWAESIEQYVMEGKAPSVELQPVMRRFAAWLKSVYQSIKQFVAGRPGAEQQPLNDDIRRVMDRMLATDEQIAQANEVAGLMPDEQADGEAAERLQKRSIADLKWAVKARDKVIAKLKREARDIEKQIRTEVTAEVEQRPEVLAKAAIEKAEKEFEADPVAADMNIAAIADSFGYPSVEAMYRAIELFGDKREAIDGIVERRMLEEHGDLIDERAITEAANEAVHNEARARSLATELRTQQEMLSERADTGQVNARGARVTVNVLVEAAKQFGANVIARTPLKDLRVTAWKHTAAERRAGKRWTEATMAGDTQAAVQAKQDQMLNNAAAKAALEATAESKKILEFFARVTKGNDEKTVEKGRDPDIVNAARAVLAAYGVQSPASKGAAAYLEVLQKNDPDTFNAIAPMMAAATQNAQPLEALTFEELQGLHEQIRAMWFLAKRSRQMEVDGNLLDIDDVAQELFARMEAIGIPDRVPGEGMAVTKEEERGLFLKQGIAFLRRVEQWAEGMDGKYGGPFLRFIFQPIKDAADRYRKDRIEYRKRFQALVDNLAPIVGDSVIEAPELGYTFGTPGSTAGTAMNEILHAIAHTGNESNKRKLLLGRGWATENPDGTLDTTAWDTFLRRLVNEGKLERAHFDFVQGVWDLLEDTKPLAQKAHRDAFGRFFSEVTADAFVDPFGVTRRGGYVPAQVDTRLVKDNALRKLAEEENNSMAFAFPQPAKGFTMARTEYNRPLMLDLRSLSQHIDKVLLFSHMTNPARDVRKLLTRKTVSQPLDRIQPAALESMLQPWLQRSAQQIVETPVVGSGKWARLPGIIRARAGMALMFLNVSNAVQQIAGLTLAAVRVKPSFLMRSVAQYVANPVKFSQAVWNASPYMDDRAKNEVAVLNEQMQAILLKPSTYERAQDWGMRHAYFLQTALDNVLSPIVWTGAFNQALADGMSDADAIRFADSTVRQTQGSTLPEDVSRLETGPAYARVFTQFLNYFNMQANTNGTALKQIASEVGLRKGAGKALYVVMMGFMASIWIAEAIALAFRGGPEDEDDDGYLDDWLAEVFGMGTAKGLLAQIPIIGQFGVAAASRFNDNPLDDRVSLSPAVSLLESAVGAPQSVYSAIVEDGSAQKAIRDVATLVSVATGVPVYGLARPIGYAAGVAQGRIEPEGPVDLARGLVTGTASPESRVP